MKKYFIFTIFFLIGLLILIIPNFGKILNTTTKPIESDLVVCLGGGTIERVKKSLSLMDKGLVKSNKLLLIGESWYNQPYIKKNRPNINIEINETPKNTIQEVVAIKKYMIKNNFKSALIVTDSPHSARVTLLSYLLQVEHDDNIEIHLINSDISWWKETNYYLDKRSRDTAIHETLGILYSILFYNPIVNIFRKEY